MRRKLLPTSLLMPTAAFLLSSCADGGSRRGQAQTTGNLNAMSGSGGLEVYDDLFTNLVCSSNNPVNLPESCATGVFANGSGKLYVHATCNTGTCQADGATFSIQLQ